jgi:hypothetical protein
MSSNLFPPDFRVLGPLSAVTGAEDSLEAVNTSELPDGCLAVVTNNQVFVLNKFSTATAVSGVIVAPAQGGVGRWLLLVAGAGEQLSRAIQLTAALADFAVVSNTWTLISGAVFASQGTPSALFSLTTASGRLTYNGPSGRYFEICVEASIGNGESGAAIEVAVAASVNGDVSSTTDYAIQQQAVTNATQDVPNYVHATRYAVLTNGFTIDPIVKNITAGDLDLNIQKLVMTVRPVL